MNFTVALLLTIVVAVAHLFKVIDSQQCGTRKVTINEVIVRGWDTVPREFPWHVAIYHRKGRSDSYACGGTLLNARFVMTADHCVKDDNGFVLSPKRIFVRLGLNNLNTPNLRNTQQHEVLTVHRVPEANGKKNDIALLELSTEAQFDEFVQPACVNHEPAITGLLGTAVGWGFTESDELSPVLKATRMPPWTVPRSAAGYTNGSTAVCNGDSGGGLHVKRGSAWFVVGIISFTTPRDADSNLCRVDSYAAFTNVVVFVPWIRSVVGSLPEASSDERYHISSTELNWFEAVEYCHRRGMQPAILDSQAKHDMAVREAQATGRQSSGFFGLWLGASDLAKDRSYVWQQTGAPVLWAKWSAGEPSGPPEHCMTLYYWPDRQFDWETNDAPCDTTLYAMCQERSTKKPSVQPCVDCNVQYHISSNELNWFEAIEYCNRRGMRPAVLDSQAKHDQAVREAKATGRQSTGFFGLWVGASDLAKTGSYVWQATGAPVTWAKWSAGEPSGPPEHCMTLYYWPERQFDWEANDAPCDTTLYALCQKEVAN
ncbi:hypothetical protein pipiens_003159 [Culex pipiens pipiens]|uniref:Uncharacterized protein n=1 Tax=Culex pipiens pipiens TaxID=38569 RepID=A0ABD1D3W8_CULPP